jgi:hypothetical protein
MGERVAAVHTDSRAHVRNADDEETRRKVMLYCLLKTLFIRLIPKTFAKSDYRLRHVCRSVRSLHMEKLKFYGTDCH